ncbi:hypothetical protein C8Q72DRAFT_155728 [Fomitopsis betulina]|nr:hypothetical protein C8Q72DRAFT_155728 [Fomitopsis betulina]
MDSSTYSLCDDDRNVKEVVIKDTTCYYGLTLVNRSQHDLFIYVFSFDPADCSISTWYHAQSHVIPSLPQGQQSEIGHGASERDTVRFTRPETHQQSIFIKIFVTNEYVDMSSLEQLQWRSKPAGRKYSGVSMVSREPIVRITRIPTTFGWSSSIHVLTVPGFRSH